MKITYIFIPLMLLSISLLIASQQPPVVEEPFYNLILRNDFQEVYDRLGAENIDLDSEFTLPNDREENKYDALGLAIKRNKGNSAEAIILHVMSKNTWRENISLRKKWVQKYGLQNFFYLERLIFKYHFTKLSKFIPNQLAVLKKKLAQGTLVETTKKQEDYFFDIDKDECRIVKHNLNFYATCSRSWLANLNYSFHKRRDMYNSMTILFHKGTVWPDKLSSVVDTSCGMPRSYPLGTLNIVSTATFTTILCDALEYAITNKYKFLICCPKFTINYPETASMRNSYNLYQAIYNIFFKNDNPTVLANKFKQAGITLYVNVDWTYSKKDVPILKDIWHASSRAQTPSNEKLEEAPIVHEIGTWLDKIDTFLNNREKKQAEGTTQTGLEKVIEKLNQPKT